VSGSRWFRDTYRDAIWEDETLTATEKAVAETYARHARDRFDEKTAQADLAWLTYDRLMTKAGIGRRANVAAAITALVKGGWLVPHIEVPRRPTVYRLTIPELGSSTIGTTSTPDASSDVGTSVVPDSTAGSSTQSGSSRSASSDGGTPPLEDLPREVPPSSSARAGIEELRVRITIASDDEALFILEMIKANTNGPIRTSMAKLLTAIPDEHLIDYRDRYRSVRLNTSTWPTNVEKCGQCDVNRMIEVEDATGRGLLPARCPNCHPGRRSSNPTAHSGGLLETY
jgi:hypothetical protein